MFTLGAYKQEGNGLQRGLRGSDLFISIMSLGAFGFKVDTIKHRSYVAEKLNLSGDTTIEKFTELLNGIIAELVEE